MTSPDLSPWYHHNIDPVALRWGDVSIPWYWIVYVLGWFWCAWILNRTAAGTRDGASPETQARLHGEFLLWGWIAMLFGARMTYVLVYNFEYYATNPDQIPALWNGGMSFHGGFIGIALSAWIISRRHHVSIFALTDPIALAIPWMLALGRLANFANGELPGRVSALPWAVVFPSPFDGVPRHPSQLYEAIGEGLLVGLILWWNRRAILPRRGYMSFAFTGLYAASRFFIEFTREPDPQIGLILGLTMGQWLCLIMMLLAVFGIGSLARSRDPAKS